MTSVLSTATHTAHSLAASLLSTAQVKPGSTLPAVEVKENSAEHAAPLSLKGKNIIVGLPGAFTETCTNAHVPAYIANYEKFKAKGINDIYIVSVNDLFVMQAWKKSLASEGTAVHFVADDDGTFTGALGIEYLKFLSDMSLSLTMTRSNESRWMKILQGWLIRPRGRFWSYCNSCNFVRFTSKWRCTVRTRRERRPASAQDRIMSCISI
ncbi:hypothetical protein APHAL10511_008164 [Amanita phalloides]|nr:hypothetical protein APHAL10511_008164 [Amanita phalloides]